MFEYWIKCCLALGVCFHQQHQVCLPFALSLGEWPGLVPAVLALDQGKLGSIPSPPSASWCCTAQIPSLSLKHPSCDKRVSHWFLLESSRPETQQQREGRIGTIQTTALCAMAWAQESMRLGQQLPLALVLEEKTLVAQIQMSFLLHSCLFSVAPVKITILSFQNKSA